MSYNVPAVPLDKALVHQWGSNYLNLIRSNLIHNQVLKLQKSKNDFKLQQTITETYSRCTTKKTDKVSIIAQRFIDPNNPLNVIMGDLTMRPREVHTSLRLEFIKSSTNNWATSLPVQQLVSPIFNNMNKHGTGGTKITVNQDSLSDRFPDKDTSTIESLKRIRDTINSGITSHVHTIPTETNDTSTPQSSSTSSQNQVEHALSNVRWRFTQAVKPTKDLQEFKDTILANMKRQSVSGPDAMTLEIVLGLTDEVMETLRIMVNYLLQGGHIPGSEIGQISPLQKDENRTRPIALMNFIRKAAETWCAYHTARLLDEFKLLQPNQFGSILNGGCSQPIFILNQLMEYAVRHDRELYILLLDASEAYTSIPFELIIIAFKRLGASDLYCNFIWSILQNQSWNLTSIYGLAEGDPIKPTAGAPQGGPLSPIIFIVVQDLIASHINIHGNSLGFQLRDDELSTDTTVSNMIIVDDVTMTSGTAENAQKLLDLAAEINIACGIRGNPSKTLISHSPAAYSKSCNTDDNGILQKPVYTLSLIHI